MLEPSSLKTELLRKALNNLLKQKDYHIAPPTKKNLMVLREYTKILRKKRLNEYSWKKPVIKE